MNKMVEISKYIVVSNSNEKEEKIQKFKPSTNSISNEGIILPRKSWQHKAKAKYSSYLNMFQEKKITKIVIVQVHVKLEKTTSNGHGKPFLTLRQERRDILITIKIISAQKRVKKEFKDVAL